MKKTEFRKLEKQFLGQNFRDYYWITHKVIALEIRDDEPIVITNKNEWFNLINLFGTWSINSGERGVK